MKPFRASYKGRDIFDWHPPRTGTQYTAVLEWALAARWWGYRSLEEFQQLDGTDQSFLIAVYRTARQIEAVESWQAQKRSS